MNSTRQAATFLRALQEEGITEIPCKNIRRIQKPITAATKAATQSPTPIKVPLPESVQPASWEELKKAALICDKCSVLVKNRHHVVFGSGNVQAKLMFVGEAPGRDEDLQGLPFVGAAGQLLTKIIESIGLSRDTVYIANVLKCRPPNNRPPKPDEIVNCEPFLQKQIDLIQPEIICCLGTFASQTLLKTTTAISQLRGTFHPFGNSRVLCTFHPAYLLRNPAEKRKVWEDMKKIKKELDLLS